MWGTIHGSFSFQPNSLSELSLERWVRPGQLCTYELAEASNRRATARRAPIIPVPDKPQLRSL